MLFVKGIMDGVNNGRKMQKGTRDAHWTGWYVICRPAGRTSLKRIQRETR